LTTLIVTHLVLSFDCMQTSFSPNTHESSHAFTETSSQTTLNPTQDTRPHVGSRPNTMETKSSGRMELPEVIDASICHNILCF